MILGLRFLVVLGLINIPVNCFPGGPPRSACRDGLPVHTHNGKLIKAQTRPSPYRITVNATTFQPGDTLAIRIHSPVGEMFKGLFVQLRPLPNPDENTFKNAPMGEYNRRVMNTKPTVCVNSQDTLVHKDPFMKIETKFDWKAPLLINNDVVVRATILKDFGTFWTNVESVPIKLVRDKVLPAEMLAKPWLREIIQTVKAGDNETLKRQFVRERFEKGFNGAFDPSGYIMVQYLNDILPFEDRFESDVNSIVVINNNNISGPENTTRNTSDSSSAENDGSMNAGAVETSASENGEPTVEIPLGVEIKKGNSSKMSEYETLVTSLLRGDYKQITQLERMLTPIKNEMNAGKRNTVEHDEYQK